MRCGEKCFHVQLELDGEKQVLPVNARTPAEARKNVRIEYGKETVIYSVRERRVRPHVSST